MNKSASLPRHFLPFFKWKIFILSLLFSTGIVAQEQFTLKWVKQPLSVIFADIEKTSKVSFAYNPTDININIPVTLRVRKADMAQLLAAVCEKVNARYRITGNTIMIQSKPLVNSSIRVKEFILIGKLVDANNDDLAGATIYNLRNRKASISKDNGSFSVKTNEQDAVVISKIGYQSKTVYAAASDKIMVIELQIKALDLNPVVVTALGIKREKRSLGYSVGEVKGSEINKAREVNVINSLAGKVAGLVINNTAGGPSGSSRVIIRGNTEITGSNQPLYVIDGVPMDNSNYGQIGGNKYAQGYDFGDAISAVNPDDIETISVLKGPSASALYGSRAGHGVILITTKKGSAKKSLGIEFNSSSTVEKALTHFDNYQYEYGQGYGGRIPRDKEESQNTMFSSFGAKLDPNFFTPGFDGAVRSYGLVKNNIENFFKNGTTFTNTVSLTNANDNTSFRLSVSDLRNSDIVPASTMVRNTINLRGTSKFGKRLTIDAKGIYVKESVVNKPALAADASNIGLSFAGLANNIDQDIFNKGYKDVNGTYVEWGGGPYKLNPYWVINEMRNNTKKDRLLTSLQANYTITDWLSFQGRISSDITFLDFRKFYPRTTPGALLGRIEGIKRNYNTTEADALLLLKKQVSPDLFLSATLGASMSQQRTPSVISTGTDMQVTDVISFNSFKDKLIRDELYAKRINSFYGLFSAGFKNYLYVDATIRRDASSTLSPKNNVYIYPSVSASFIFTDAFKISNNSILSYGKVRASAAEVGSDTDPYQLDLYYQLNERSFQGQSLGAIATNTKPNAGLLPTRTRSFEVGTELRFLKNRLNLDITYYKQKSRDQINYVPLPVTSGFEQEIINAGTVSNSGIELLIGGTPVKTKNVSWDISFNFAKNKNVVNSLANGVPFLVLSDARWLGVSVVAMPGAAYGAILGYDYQRDPNGNIILSPVDLSPLPSDNRTVLGKGTWDWTGGINQTLTYKNFSFSAGLDIKMGANLFSMTNLYGVASGLDIKTLEGRKEFIHSEEKRLAAGKTSVEWEAMGMVEGYVPKGVLQTGTDAAGKPVYTVNTKAIDPALYWNNLVNDNHGIVVPFLYDASYVKVRQLMLSYNVHAKILSKLSITGASISVVSTNPFIISKHVPNIDPDSNYSNGNGQGFEYGSLPSRKSWGINLNVRF
jgi:TonB-linked SusC/RagA family outer membrane protein